MWDSKIFKAGVAVLLLFFIIQTGSQSPLFLGR